MQVTKCPSETCKTDYPSRAHSACANHYQKWDTVREPPLVSHNMTIPVELLLNYSSTEFAREKLHLYRELKLFFFFLLLSSITSPNRLITGEKEKQIICD